MKASPSPTNKITQASGSLKVSPIEVLSFQSSKVGSGTFVDKQNIAHGDNMLPSQTEGQRMGIGLGSSR